MNVLDALFGTDGADDSDPATDGGGGRARCRNCGRYYGAATETCPHCGSANKLLGGPAGGQDQRR